MLSTTTEFKNSSLTKNLYLFFILFSNRTYVVFFKKIINEPNIEKGKKLGFVGQEIGREINTIGSKSNHLLMQQTVVEMKNDLEKIKEQLLNVL